jgi:hypothetical protein
VWKCPKAGPEEAKWLFQEMKAANNTETPKKRTPPMNRWVSGEGEEPRSVPCQIGGVHVETVLDSGADQSVLCPRLVEKFEADGVWLRSRALGRAVELAGFQEGLKIIISWETKMGLDFSAFAGRLLLNNVLCWVAATPLAAGLGEILGIRREMAVMGTARNRY